MEKIKRVYPLYFVTTMFTIAYSGIPLLIANHAYGEIKPLLIQLFKCILLIQSWYPNGYFSFNGVGWFLSTIIFLYLMNVPLNAVMGRLKKKKFSKLIYLAVALGSIIFIVIYCYMTRNTHMEYTQYVLPISRLGEYVCGMSMGYLMYSISESIDEGNKKNAVMFLFTAFEIIVLGVWITNMYLPYVPWHFRIVHWVFPNIILIVIFSIGKGLVSQLFRVRWLRYLGDISFECFLIHQIFIREYSINSCLGHVSRLGNAFSLFYCICGTVILASLVHYPRKAHK